MNENIRDKIYFLMKVEDPNSPQYLIAQEILREINVGEKLNSSVIADKTFTSKPTVIRFAQSLGFRGFKDFNEKLMIQESEYFFVAKNKNYQQSYLDYKTTLKQLVSKLDEELPTLINIATLIKEKKKIYLFASKQHIALMKNFSEKLRFLNIEVFESSVASLFFLNIINENDLTLFLLSGIVDNEILKIWDDLGTKTIKIAITSHRQLGKISPPDYVIEVNVGPNLLRVQLQNFLFSYILDQLYNLIVYSDDIFIDSIDQHVILYN